MLRQRCRFITPFVALVLIGWMSYPIRAADWPVRRGPSHEPAPYQYDPGQWKHVPKAFLEDSSACTLYTCTSHLVEADGSEELILHEITRLNGRKGIEKLGEYKNISYDPTYQVLTLNEARVIKPGGRFVPIEPRNLQLRDMSTDYLVYDHDKQLIISFPNLEVGDAIEVKWTIRGRNPEYGGHFFTRYNFGDDNYPVVRDEMCVRLPKDKPLKYGSVGGKVEPTIVEDKDHRLYRWQVKDRPQLTTEDDAPSREDLRLQVSCSTITSWEEVGKWKKKVRENCWECSADVRQIVQEVTKGLKTPLEKARALTYWVRRNIRYVSVGEKHDYTPHSPSNVFTNRYGDCKDQSQLLAVMLREAGIPVGLATLGTLGDGQVLESVPSPWGTHAILVVSLDGKDHWIDTTVSLAGWDFLPRDDRDRLCYVLEDKGLKLKRTPRFTPADNLIEQTTVLSVGADGSSRSERTVTYHGSAALSQRDSWMEVPPGERRRLMTAELQDANSRTRLCRLEVDERKLKDFDQPVSARIVFEVPAHFTGDAAREGSITDSKVWNKLLAYNLDYDRQVALNLVTPFEVRHHYTVQLPPALVFDALPQGTTITSRWGEFRLRVHAKADNARRIELDLQTRLDNVLVEPADFEDFHKFHEEVAKHYRIWLTLRPTQDPADALALELLLAVAPEDNASALVLAQLYQQTGKPAEARRVLQRARYYKPNDVALGEMAVKVAENLQEEEKAYRDLVHRFPDELKYAVALGTTLINRGEYDQARTVLGPILEKGTAANQAQAHYQLARGCLAEGQAGAALKHVEAAEQADADSLSGLPALLFKARVYEKLGRPKDASATYRDALKLDAESAEALGALVRLALKTGDKGEALDSLRRYTVAVGKDLDGLIAAAEYHLRLGRFEDAFELASRAREERFHQRAQAILGLVYLHRGEAGKAVFHLERADADPLVVEGLLRGYLAVGKFREAEDQLKQAARLPMATPELSRAVALVNRLVQRRDALLQEARPSQGKVDVWRNAASHFVCAEYAHEEGQPAERVELLLKEVFAENVDFGPAHGLRGVLALEKGRLGPALAEGERAVALSPESARGYYVRGRVRLERMTEGALTDLEKAATLSQRKDGVMLHWLAAAQFQAGRRTEALATQREAVKLRPTDEALAEQLRQWETQSSRR